MADNKIKLQFKGSTLGSVSELQEETRNLEALKEYENLKITLSTLTENLKVVTTQLEELHGLMQDVNVNIHPLQSHVLEHWRNLLFDCVTDLKTNTKQV